MKDSVNKLVELAEGFLESLCFLSSTLQQYRRAWAQISEYCSARNVVELTDEVVTSYLGSLETEQRDGLITQQKRALLRRAILILAEVAATGGFKWKAFRETHPNDRLGQVFTQVQVDFEEWLKSQGLAETTMDAYASISRSVLAGFSDRGISDVRSLTSADMSTAVVCLGEHYQPGSMKMAVAVLRVLCRFFEETGSCEGLLRAVLTVRTRHVTTVQVLSAESVEKLVSAPDPATPIGRRDRAILLLAARTGLRPSDITGLRLTDIDWRQSQITLTQRKTQTTLTLPLLADVGSAISAYILDGRPTNTAEDHVFLLARAPFTPLQSSSLRNVSGSALAKAGIEVDGKNSRGLRLLRSSLATRMLENDTSVPVISQALGHRAPTSAKHYLGTDEARMRQCCLDFTGIEPSQVKP